MGSIEFHQNNWIKQKPKLSYRHGHMLFWWLRHSLNHIAHESFIHWKFWLKVTKPIHKTERNRSNSTKYACVYSIWMGLWVTDRRWCKTATGHFRYYHIGWLTKIRWLLENQEQMDDSHCFIGLLYADNITQSRNLQRRTIHKQMR